MLPPLRGCVRRAHRGFTPPVECLIPPLCPRPVPGAVGHLSFTEILDTSLKVSWSEPGEKNGVLTGIYSQIKAGDVCQSLNDRGSPEAAPRQSGARRLCCALLFNDLI